MKSRKLLVALAVIALLAAGFLLARQFAGPALNLQPSAAAGELLADEVGRLVSGTGNVLIVAREASKEGSDAMGRRIASFTSALQHCRGLKLVATEWIPRVPRGTMDLGGVSQEQLQAALEKNPNANLAVVFGGLPPYSPSLAEQLTTRSLKLVAVCGYSPALRRWLEADAVALAVVPRLGDAPAGGPPPRTAKEWFDREFQVVTPANLAQMPY